MEQGGTARAARVEKGKGPDSFCVGFVGGVVACSLHCLEVGLFFEEEPSPLSSCPAVAK